MKKFRSFLFFSLGILVLLALSGCGSGYSARSQSQITNTSPFGTDPTTGIAYVGASICINCHKTVNIPGTGISNDIVFNFLSGEHVIHSTHINSVANTAVTLPSGQPGECATCHNPIGDGYTIQGLVPASDLPDQGDLFAVTCEACHGPGGHHYGTGPIPNPTPDWTACGNTNVGSCHAGPKDDHITYHPENFPVANTTGPAGISEPASWIAGGWPAGRTSILYAYEKAPNSHINSIKAPNYVTGSTTDVKGLCSRCHTDQGAKLYKNANGDSTQLDAQFPNDGASNPVTNASPVQCRTCHDPHNNIGETSGGGADGNTGQKLWGNAGLLLNGTTMTINGQKQWVSGQFRTCNNCHQLVNPNDGTWLVGISNDTSGGLEVGHHDVAASSYNRIGFSTAEGSSCFSN